MRVFARDGYTNASIAEVASQVGLTLPGLLHYFPSKITMLLAVLELRDLRSPHLPGKQGTSHHKRRAWQRPTPVITAADLIAQPLRGTSAGKRRTPGDARVAILNPTSCALVGHAPHIRATHIRETTLLTSAHKKSDARTLASDCG